MFWLGIFYIIFRLIWEFFRDVRWSLGTKPDVFYVGKEKSGSTDNQLFSAGNRS